MDSAASTNSDVFSTQRSFSTSQVLMGNPKDAGCAIEEDLGELVRNIEEGTQGTDVKLLASGGYNDIWLVKRPIEGAKRFVLRKPREDALLPDQIRNEVACLEYIKKNLSNIPVPRVYSHYFKDSSSEGVFIAEELIEGDRLSDVWSTFDESTKMSFARQIAEIIVDLGERNFSGIGGLMLDGKLGPTVEGMKLFKGRNRFHSQAYYDIGPYDSTREYVLACYDKEICYYTRAPDEDIDWDLFESVSRDEWIKQLQSERDSIEQNPSAFLSEEPFVLVHGDLHGRNIMVKDGRIGAVLDWEFAGAYPLSELLGGMGVDVLEVDDERSAEECSAWSEKIVELASEIARRRGWKEWRVEMLVADGNMEMQRVRVEMFP